MQLVAGAAAGAAGRTVCVKHSPAKVSRAQSSRPAAQHSSSTPHAAAPQQRPAVRAAAAGDGDSSSTCSSPSLEQQQQQQQQQPWRCVQPAVLDAQPAAGAGNGAAGPASQPGGSLLASSGGGASSSGSSNSSLGSPPSSQQQLQRPPSVANGSSSNSRQHSHRRAAALKEQPGNQQLTGAAIMQQLKAAGSWQQLHQLVLQHGSELNWRHSSAVMAHLAQLSTHQPNQQQQQQQQGQGPGQQQLSGMPEQPLCSQQDQYSGGQQPFQPVQQRAEDASSRNSSSSSRQASTGRSETEAGLQDFLQCVLMPLLDSHLQSYDARGLANCLWAVAKLRAVAQPPSSWLQQFCSTSQPLLQQFDAQQLSNTLWGLVQLQHVPSQAWLQSWYAAMLQACRPEDPGWQPQSVSSALWALAQLLASSSNSSSTGGRGGSSSSRSAPSSEWLDQLLTAALQRVAAPAAAGTSTAGSSSSNGRGHSRQCRSDGQVVSNALWACVQLQQQLGLPALLSLQSWLQRAAAAEGHCSGSNWRQQQLSDQALANCMWALGKLHQQRQEEQQHQRQQWEPEQQQCVPGCSAGTRSQSRVVGVAHHCGRLLLQLSSSRLEHTSNQHLSLLVWGAGALSLKVQQPAVAAVMQQLAARAGSLTDQQVSNLAWGLSHIKQQPQPTQPQQQQQQQQQDALSGLQDQQHQQQLQPAECIDRLLVAQVGRLQGFSSQAIGSTLLSLARMQHMPDDATLHAWLHALSGRALASSSDAVALTDACCALALLRQQQEVAGAASSVGWGMSRSSSSSAADGQWLQGVCADTASRLGVFTAEQLCALGWAMTLLRFRAPVPWLTAWQAAVVDRADGMSGALAARALRVLQGLPGIAAIGGADLQEARARLAAAAAESATAAAAAGRPSAADMAAAAAAVAATSSRDGAQRVGQLLQFVPGVLSSCTTRQLAQLLCAAAAVQAPLPPGLLPAVLHQAQQQHSGQHMGSSMMGLLVGVAKVQRLQQHQQQQPGRPAAQQHDQQQAQELPPEPVEQEQQQLLQWLQQTVPQLPLGSAGPAYLSAVLWALAVLGYHPGSSWLEAWAQHSEPVLQQMSPQQLASCGWALTVLRHRPGLRWLGAWARAVEQHMASAAVPPRSLALLLYSSATLSCPVTTPWLRSAGALAARQVESWAAADVADGLWGLGRLGLRAVAEEEVLEALLDRLVGATAAQGQLQLLSPHRQLQALQAAVLLGHGADSMPAQQQQLPGGRRLPRLEQQQEAALEQQQARNNRRRKLRWLNFRAYTAAGVARQLAAAAAAAAQAPQQGSTGAPSRQAVAGAVGKAAVVAAKFVRVKTGRDPAAAAAAGVVKPAWFGYWCRCSLQQLGQWRPQQVAAALGAFATLGWQPPEEWQQQMLAHVVQQGRLSLQTATAIQDALVALQSPLARTWRQPLALQYLPARPSSDLAAGGAAGDSAVQWPHMAAATTPVNQQQRQQQGVGSVGVRRQPSYPHHLRGNAMRRLQRRQHLMRLVGWWRQQQLMQQQYAQQQQQRQQEEEQWRAAAAAAGVGSYAGSGYSSTSGTSSVSSPVGSISGSMSPTSSFDGGAVGSSRGGSSGSGSVNSSSGSAPGAAPRKLEGSAWGRQLLRPTARPAVAAAAPTGDSLGDSEGSSDSGAAADAGDSTQSGTAGVPAVAAAAAAGDAAAGSGASAGSEVEGQQAPGQLPPPPPTPANSSSSRGAAGGSSRGADVSPGAAAQPASAVVAAAGVVQVVQPAPQALPGSAAWGPSWAAVGRAAAVDGQPRPRGAVFGAGAQGL